MVKWLEGKKALHIKHKGTIQNKLVHELVSKMRLEMDVKLKMELQLGIGTGLKLCCWQ